ncbi:hypothetical protein AAG906_002169 [Vitis piasezkii]
MAKTRGGHSASPSSPRPPPQRDAMGAAPSPPVQAPAIPPSEGEAPSQRRYPTRRPPTDIVPPADQAASSVSRPPAKRSRFSGPGEPSHAPQPEPATEDPRIPVDMPPETVIRRPMIAGPPIEGEELYWRHYLGFRGLFLGPHHLIMASLLHFEEKVHRKKLERRWHTITIPKAPLRF